MAETLYSSKDELLFKWPLLVAANVGIFEPNERDIVPDVFISLGVLVTPEWQNKKNRSYLISEFGKAPEMAIGERYALGTASWVKFDISSVHPKAHPRHSCVIGILEISYPANSRGHFPLIRG